MRIALRKTAVRGDLIHLLVIAHLEDDGEEIQPIGARLLANLLLGSEEFGGERGEGVGRQDYASNKSREFPFRLCWKFNRNEPMSGIKIIFAGIVDDTSHASGIILLGNGGAIDLSDLKVDTVGASLQAN